MALIGIRTLMEKTGVESVCKTTYAPGPDCVPTLWEYDSVDKATGKHFPLRKLRYTKYERNSRTDEEFSLRQYGLPDPVGVTLAMPFPTYLILLLSAAALAAVAAALRYLARRKRVDRNSEGNAS